MPPIIRALAALAVLIPLAAAGCSKKGASGVVDASASAHVGAPGVTQKPPELHAPPKRGALVAIALLGGTEVTWRGVVHVTEDGVVRRLPDAWAIPYEARLATSRGGRFAAYVAPDGTVGLLRFGPSASAAVVVATDADPGAAPIFAGTGAELVYVRRDGAVVGVDGAAGIPAPMVVSETKGGVVRDLASDPAGHRIAFVLRGEAIHVVDRQTRRDQVAHQVVGSKTRLFGPRLLSDGTLFARERLQNRAKLVRLRPGGAAEVMPLPAGQLRAFEVAPSGDLWLGMARRGQRVRVGEIFVDEGGARRALATTAPKDLPTRRIVLSLPRTLPRPIPGCDAGTFWLVDESTPLARLVRVSIKRAGAEPVTPVTMRVRDAEAFAVVCAAPVPEKKNDPQ